MNILNLFRKKSVEDMGKIKETVEALAFKNICPDREIILPGQIAIDSFTYTLDLYMVNRKTSFTIESTDDLPFNHFFKDFIKWFCSRPESKIFEILDDDGSMTVKKEHIHSYKIHKKKRSI